MTTNEERVSAFLAGHAIFDVRQEDWNCIPLAFRVGLTKDIPIEDVIASVRSIMLHGDHVLLVHAEVTMLTVGGRPELGETLTEALARAVAEETGWPARPLGVIGFIHAHHLDAQRPNWGRSAPHFIDALYAAEVQSFEQGRQNPGDWNCEFVPITNVPEGGIHPIDTAFLQAAVALQSSGG